MRLACWLGLLAAACASGQSASEPRTSTDVVKATIAPQQTLDLSHQTLIHTGEFPATREQVWTALLGTAEDLEMSVQSADSATGTVVYFGRATAARISGRPASVWVDCGRGPGGTPRADTYQITLRVTAAIEPGSKDAIKVGTTLVGYARDRGMSGDGLPCTSTGALERRTLSLIAARLPS